MAEFVHQHDQEQRKTFQHAPNRGRIAFGLIDKIPDGQKPGPVQIHVNPEQPEQAEWNLGALALHRPLDELQQFRVGLDGFELRELFFHVVRRAEQKAHVRLDEHGGVVERIAGGNDVIIHPLEGGHGLALLFAEAQLVIHDAVILHHEPVAQQRRPAKLAEQGSGELLERVGQDDDLHQRAEFIQKFLCAGQRAAACR